MAAKTLRQSVGIAATPIVKAARLRIPVGTREHVTYMGHPVKPGFARDSISKRTFIEDGVAVAMVGTLKEAYYAVQFVEVGTEKMRAQPWLEPALESTQEQVVERLKNTLAKKIDKATK